MSGPDSLNGQIALGKSKIYRKCFIKRRAPITGLYEEEWVEITSSVIKWGNITKEVDASKVNSFKFGSVTMTFSNRDGKFNPNDDENSLWYGYGDQQRTLVQIWAGFIVEQKGADGIWNRAELPADSIYDEASFDIQRWDDSGGLLFNGFMSGDIFLTGTDQVSIPVQPLVEVFRQFAAANLIGLNPSLTASGFITLLRDQQDSFGQYVFRPFFGDTTSSWIINTTTAIYANLDSAGSNDVVNSTVWDIVEQLASSENFVPFAGNLGTFNFVARDYNNSTSVYSFFGVGGFSSQYGSTIKSIKKFGRVFSKYYSRVSIQFRQEDTVTSYSIKESTFRVGAASAAWALGERTLEIQNLWIPTTTVADILAADLFNEYSALKTEVEFTTSLIPQLDLMQRIDITYDPSSFSPQSIWDLYNWADDTNVPVSTDLLWDNSGGDAIKMNGREFKLISININLDNGECKFIGRE